MKHTITPLIPGMYYHINNRVNNHENLFIEKRNCSYFLSLYAKHIEPVADTFAYSLLRNHFHTSARIKTEEEYFQQMSLVSTTDDVPIPVTNDSYFMNLIFYIHYNPQKHGFVDDFRDWEWSSYHALIGTGETKLKRFEVLTLFDSVKRFEEFHQRMVDEKKLASLIDDYFELDVQT